MARDYVYITVRDSRDYYLRYGNGEAKGAQKRGLEIGWMMMMRGDGGGREGNWR